MVASRCWVCGSPETVFVRGTAIEGSLRTEDIGITNKSYGATLALRACKICGFIFADSPSLSRDTVAALYEKMQDQAYLDSIAARSQEMRRLLQYGLRQLPEARTVLDVGAGAGLLVQAAKAHGLTAWGVEPSAWLVQQAQRLFGIVLLQGTLPHAALTGRQFDIVFAVDVIEHVPDPVALLSSIRAHMGEEGVAIITTPDRSSLAARLLRGRWWHYRPAHIGYFDRRSLSMATRRAGLSVQAITRQTWYFPLRYLLERLSTYWPSNCVHMPTCILERLGSVTVPVNLRDHLVAALRKTEEPHICVQP